MAFTCFYYREDSMLYSTPQKTHSTLEESNYQISPVLQIDAQTDFYIVWDSYATCIPHPEHRENVIRLAKDI
jgi:hypothetical protein